MGYGYEHMRERERERGFVLWLKVDLYFFFINKFEFGIGALNLKGQNCLFLLCKYTKMGGMHRMDRSETKWSGLD